MTTHPRLTERNDFLFREPLVANCRCDEGIWGFGIGDEC